MESLLGSDPFEFEISLERQSLIELGIMLILVIAVFFMLKSITGN